MSLPGLALPGLTSSTPVPRTSSIAPATSPPRLESLPARSELRFEVSHTTIYKIRLTRGTAEIYGTELAHNIAYTFSGTKAAVYTWDGCGLEVQGEAESEYVGSETEYMTEWLNLHGMLDTLRDDSQGSSGGGPRVLLLGAEASGKTSLAKSLVSWAVKTSSSPTLVNLDPKEGVLAPPSGLSAVTYTSQFDVESGHWGQAGISGPSVFPGRTPLVHHYPLSSPVENAPLFSKLVTRLALDVTSKLEADPTLKKAGFVIDTSPLLARPGEGYEMITHIISEFSINVVLTLGSERLYNDISRKVAPAAGEESVHVLRISPSSGAVARDEGWRKRDRASQVRGYFFGLPRAGMGLNPHSVMVPFNELCVYLVRDPAGAITTGGLDFMPGMDDDDDYDPSGDGGSGGAKDGKVFEKVEPGQRLLNCVLAIKYVGAGAGWEAVRDAAVMGFVYAAEVDEGRKRVRFLAPHPGRWGDRVLVGGPWPEGVGDLVS